MGSLPQALVSLAKLGPVEPQLGHRAGLRALRRLEEGEQGVVVEVTAPLFSHLVTRRAKAVMEQLRVAPIGPHHRVRPPHPSARAWVGRRRPMALGRHLGLAGLEARPIPLVSPRVSWDPRPMGKGLEADKHRT